MAPKIKAPIFGTVDRGKVGAEVPYSDLIPETYFRNSLDLNRFENKVSKELIQSYNRIIIDSVRKLEAIERRPKASQPKYTAARLRSLLAQTKKSLEGWSNSSSKELIKNLDGVAKLQSEFVEEQLKKVLPAGMRSSVRSVEVSPKFAEAVVKNKATDINANVLSDDLQAAVKGVDGLRKAQGSFNLTAKMGSKITLPNGDIVSKAFRGLAEKNADLFGRTIRDGLLSGETTQQVGRRLLGKLYFGEKARTAKQLALAGGEATKMANHQISTLVRTSIQQVSDTAAQSVYKQNSDITQSYKWLATLDSRTAPQCMALDQKVFKYGQGPTPPQHFNCRCRTVATIDYEGLDIPPPNFTRSTRAAVGGPVPTGTSYGSWLQKQPPQMRAKILGGKQVTLASGKKVWRGKFQYFDKLSKKVGPDQAIAKFVSSDGSEKSLKQLQKTYGKPSNIKPKAQIKPPSKTLIAKEGKYMTKAEKAGTVKYKPLTAEQKKLIDKSVEETKFKKSVQDVVPEVATFDKLPKGEQSSIKFLNDLKLNSETEQKYWKSAKAFNSKLIPKDQFKTITPKQLARRIEDDKIAKLQKKFDNKAKKALQPKKEIKKRDLRKWDDPSFLDKKLAGESKTSAVRKSSGLGKKKSDDLFFKPKPEEIGLTKAQFTRVETTIGEWAGNDYVQLRGVQLNQAQAVGAQLNPAQVKHLKRFRDVRARTEGVRNQWARYADQMEDYIAKAPKWKGKPQGLMAGNKDINVDGTIFRGMGFQDRKVVESVIESYKRGDASLTMESWTANRNIASGFSGGTGSPHSVMVKQVNKYGTSIEPWNGLQEREILQPRGVRYKVVSSETKVWTERGVENSLTEITLEAY